MQTYHYAEQVNNLAESYCQAEEETPLPVVATIQPNLPKGAVEFKLTDSNAAPEFKIVAYPFIFRTAGQALRFVLSPAQPGFLLVAN